jgi:hypothetical protein
MNRWKATLLCWLLVLGLLPTLEARASSGLLKQAGSWAGGFFTAYLAGKAVDTFTGQDFKSQLEAHIPYLVEQIASASGSRRQALQEELDLTARQLRVVERALKVTQQDVAELQREQELILQDLDLLFERVDALEQRVDGLDQRVTDLEIALIGECLDLRTAPLLGWDDFRVRETPQAVLDDEHASQSLSLAARIYLNTCTFDLTQRGLLIQLSMVTRDLTEDLSLYATFKHIEAGGFDPTYGNQLVRYEFLLERPLYPVHGQVQEIFIPYGDIPFPHTNRAALALVLTHDGRPVYSLPDKAFQCNPGQQFNCRWGRR